MPLKIEKGLPAQAGEIFSLFRDAIADMWDKGIDQWSEVYPTRYDIETDLQLNELYCAYDDAQLTACFVLNEDQDEEYAEGAWTDTAGRCAVLHRLCVSVPHQHRGIGRQALACAEQIARRAGYTSIRLDALVLNPYAMRLYRSAGYRAVGTTVFRDRLFCLMEKVL